MPLRFAFLGAWHSHTSLHFGEAAERPEEVTLVGMYDPNPNVIASRREQWSEQLGDVHVFPSVEAALDSDIDAVVADGYVHHNLEYARRALEAGKHVLLEKPAGANLDELIEVSDLARSKGLMFQKGYMWRYNPAVDRILELAREGALGHIFYFRAHIPKPMRWYPRIPHDVGYYHGELYFEMAGHHVDIMVSLMDEPTRVHPILGRHHDPDRRWVDNAVVVHEFPDALATIDTAAMHAESGRPRRLEVYGTSGSAIHTPTGSNNLSLHFGGPNDGDEAGWEHLVIEPPAEYPSLLRELGACIRGDKEPDYSLEHDITVQRVLLLGSGVMDGNALKSEAEDS